MQSSFSAFFQLGIQHITDVNAYDHIVFLLALCATYPISAWQKIAVLVSAFTIGHSITLILAALHVIAPWYSVIEKLIPITIMLTAILNCYRIKNGNSENVGKKNWLAYMLALGFGFIHGMGFSNFFRQLEPEGKNLVNQLFAFNIGIEAGQLIIVSTILVVSFLLTHFFKIKQNAWVYFISGAAFGIAVTLLIGSKN